MPSNTQATFSPVPTKYIHRTCGSVITFDPSTGDVQNQPCPVHGAIFGEWRQVFTQEFITVVED